MTLSNQFSVFDKLCDMCNHFQCSCRTSLTTESINLSSLTFEECIATDLNIRENSKIIISENTSSILSRASVLGQDQLSNRKSVYINIDDSNIEKSRCNELHKCSEMSTQANNGRNKNFHDDSKRQLIPKISLPSNKFSDKTTSYSDINEETSFSNSNGNTSLDSLSLNLKKKGYNVGHLNVQGLCGDNLSKFSEISTMLTNKENEKLHIFGMSETKLKQHKLTGTFKIKGFQTPFRKDNVSNGGGGILVYVRDYINAERREDLETNDISCLWLEISPDKGKSFLVGNMYRPPDSKIEYNDRFEDFIDTVLNEGKEFILLGDINKNLLNNDIKREWGNFIASLGLTQLVSEPTRVTNDSSTLIDHIYTNNEENIRNVNVEKLSISDHYGIFCNRSSRVSSDKNHQYHAKEPLYSENASVWGCTSRLGPILC